MIKAVTVILIVATLFFGGCGTNIIEPDLNKSVKVVDANKTEKTSQVDCNCTAISTASNTVISNSGQKTPKPKQKIIVPVEDDDCTSGLIYGRKYKTILAE